MTNPVPGKGISTPYGRRGSYWSCNENSAGDGIHTGADYAASSGTKVVAARGGTVVHCNHGSAFGNHQIEVRPGDGTRDFYAHMASRAPDGSKVNAGDKIGTVGAEGNVTGPHLHFERHKTATGGWSCSVVTDPAPSINAGTDASKWAGGDVYVGKLKHKQQDSDSVQRLCYRLRHHNKMPASHVPPHQVGNYSQEILEAVRYWQRNIAADLKGPSDGSALSNPQANSLFGDNYTVHNK